MGVKQKVICPSCSGVEIKEIIYGMPDFASFDFERYEVGGCCITDNDPKYLCLNCSKSW